MCLTVRDSGELLRERYRLNADDVKSYIESTESTYPSAPETWLDRHQIRIFVIVGEGRSIFSRVAFSDTKARTMSSLLNCSPHEAEMIKVKE